MNRLERPVVSVDVVLLTLQAGRLAVLLPAREEEPFRGAPALPGVAVCADEPLLTAARRALRDKAGLPAPVAEAAHLEQLAAFDGVYRDPRGRTISVAQMGLVPEGQALSSGWQAVPGLARASLPFDHDLIVQTALQRLRGKLRYTNIAGRLLPELFRMDELQLVYEAILGRRLHRANFRTKLLRIGLLDRAGVAVDAVGAHGGRPPHLYRFRSSDVEPEDRDFL